MSDDDKTYQIGYRKPPPTSRFKSGQSGNPKGRPRGSKNFDTVLTKELNTRVVINENGKRKTVTKRDAIGKQMVNKAAGGDPKFIPILLEETRRIDERKQVGVSLSVFETPEDERVLASLLQRLKAAIKEEDSNETLP